MNKSTKSDEKTLCRTYQNTMATVDSIRCAPRSQTLINSQHMHCWLTFPSPQIIQGCYL